MLLVLREKELKRVIKIIIEEISRLEFELNGRTQTDKQGLALLELLTEPKIT